ncbi:MAG: hypothetical protein P1U80_09480 [Pseudomonadales bacterium]|nr:hypothetical protein [Pseudomonadales bacterium]
MEFFRRINQRTLLLWSLLLSLSLLCAQGVGLHAHSVGHGHDERQNHIDAADWVEDHAYMGKAHFVHDRSHNDHHDGSASEIDLSPNGLLKNFQNIFVLALIVFFIAVVTSLCSRHLIRRNRENEFTPHRYYTLSPPLRAPPQH